MSLGRDERCEPPFDDGEPIGLTFTTNDERAEVRRRLLATGLVEVSPVTCSHGTDRLRVVADLTTVRPGSAEHRAQALALGAEVAP